MVNIFLQKNSILDVWLGSIWICLCILTVYCGRKGISRLVNNFHRNKYSSFGTLIKILLVKVVGFKSNFISFCIVWWLVYTTFHAAFKVLFNIQENVCIGSVYQKYSSPHLFSWEVLKILKRQFLIVFINSDWVTVVEKIF